MSKAVRSLFSTFVVCGLAVICSVGSVQASDSIGDLDPIVTTPTPSAELPSTEPTAEPIDALPETGASPVLFVLLLAVLAVSGGIYVTSSKNQ